jgi:hypothetical protein
METPDAILTVDDVAALARVTRTAVLDAIGRGDLRAKKFGNRLGYRIRMVDYLAWIATPTQPAKE